MNAPLLPTLPGYDNPQLIAHGTTALVFRATQTRLNRPVAIKVITADTGSVPVNAARELATTVALSSQPHIVSIIDTGVTDDDRPYIVMEYCEGGSYAQILRHDGLLPVDDVLEVGVKIGEALHAAHQAGIVHRDVKPSNILRSRFGPALTDFGIARAPDELGGTLTREMMTPHHASPEALLHQAQSGISDIYSLASTMWTLLIGHPPFVDPTRPAVDMYAFRDRVLHDALPPMTRDDVPPWLIGELDRAMSKLPSSRHGSALEFAEALRRGALGLSPAPKPTSQVHVSGMPAQAWPVPDPAPIGMPPPKAAGVRDPAPLIGPPPRIPPVRASGAAPAQVGAAASGTGAGPELGPQTRTQPDSDVFRPEPRTPHPRVPEPRTTESRAFEPRMPARPEARPDLDSDDGTDEGGWLGPATDWQSTSDSAGRGAASAGTDLTNASTQNRVPPHTSTGRRFDELDLSPPPSRHRGTLLAVLVGAAVLAVAGAAVLVLVLSSSGDSPTASGSVPTVPVSPTRFISAQTVGQPRDIRITEDRGTSLTVVWTDPTAGTVTFVVVGTGPGGQKLDTKPINRGTTKATYTQLSPTKNYCFVVGAVYAVDRVALADEVCTKR